ncbi:MAG: DUF1398 family protein [Bdellovibrionota bacterium]
MNELVVKPLLEKSLARQITFPEILSILAKEGVESYHVDFLRNECRYYSKDGGSLALSVSFEHDGVAPDFSQENLESINQRVQAGLATFADFVKEGCAAGCAYYIVYINGRKVRYFGRNGDEHIQHFPNPK